MKAKRLNAINKPRFYYSIVFLLMIILILFFIKVSNKPIIVGFCAQLTGEKSELGVQERNGVQLAIEKVNKSGGIDGRTISLIIGDDSGKPKKAQDEDRELINDGAVAIIGHATSAQTLAGLKVTNPAKTVMIGATISTPKLSGIDDYFFRVYPSFAKSSEAFAEYIYKTNRINRMAIIYDEDNSEYSKTYSKIFNNKFNSLGGRIVRKIEFSSETQPDFSSILLNLKHDQIGGLLIVASDMDTAVIAQKVRLLGWQIPMFSSGWAQTNTLIRDGGQAVEGMKFEHSYDINSKSPAFAEFELNYTSRFGSSPSFGAAFSYEATLVLAKALEISDGNRNRLKEALLKIGKCEGLTDSFSFDKYGDVNRPYYLSTIRHGKFVIIKKLTSDTVGGD